MEEVHRSSGNNLLKENGVLPLARFMLSPDASSTTSDTPTPPNGFDDKAWCVRYQSIGICEEQRQLLGTEEESSDKHSSDGETDVNDVWSITEEQHQYYEKQFKILEPDINGVIGGPEAKAYFHKSKLPVEDLRKIWQLSDVTRDGALSLAEFKIAMHLVVLKRNNIELPEALPKSLVCTVPIVNNASTVNATSPSLSNPESSSPQIKGKEWTKFADSPTSSISSPGPKPVNFDFQRPTVEQNPKILHPVAVRATPVPKHAVEESKSESRKMSGAETASSSDSVPKPIQRPQPKKPTAPGIGAIPPPPYTNTEDSNSSSGPTSLPVITNKKEPPPPPPRPIRTHFRSSSLDLSKLGKVTNSVPSIPPRNSPNSGSPIKFVDSQLISNPQFADFTQCYHGAFQVYKRTETKPNSEYQAEEKKVVPEMCLEEKNCYLRKVCQELQKELNSLREERIALQFKLEKLHSRSPPPVHSPL